MPWPGEPFKAYETRSARIERQVINPLRVLISAGGTSKYIPFKQGSFATPTAFMLDDSGRLWMGADKGEWGGQYSYMELRTGNIHSFDTGSGVLGFLKARDGRVLAYGGMSHMGMESGFIADVSKKSALYLREFTNRPKTELPETTKRVLDQAKAGRPAELEGHHGAQSTSSLKITLATGFGCCPRTMFTVVIATSLNGKKSQTSEADGQGVGTTRSVTRRLFGECLQLARITLT